MAILGLPASTQVVAAPGLSFVCRPGIEMMDVFLLEEVDSACKTLPHHDIYYLRKDPPCFLTVGYENSRSFVTIAITTQSVTSGLLRYVGAYAFPTGALASNALSSNFGQGYVRDPQPCEGCNAPRE